MFVQQVVKKRIRNIIVSKGLKSYIVSVEDVMMFFYENRNVFAVTAKNEILLCDMELSSIINHVHDVFFRINRQVIVNIDLIDSFTQESNYKIIIHPKIFISEVNLTVSKNNVSRFKEWVKYQHAFSGMIDDGSEDSLLKGAGEKECI